MTKIELLEHVLDNLKKGKSAGSGLLFVCYPCESINLSDIDFNCASSYSLVPKTHILNGVEVPISLANKPNYGEKFFIEDPTEPGLYLEREWENSHVDNLWFKRGLCYSTPVDAMANCKARYGIK